MNYKIRQDFFGQREAGLGKVTLVETPKTAIVVHNTTGTASAAANVNYFRTGGNNTSAHVVIDEDEVIEILPFKYRAHHAGSWNPWTIGIEIARSGDRETDRYDRAEAIAIDYMVTILIEQGWKPNAERIKFHRHALATSCPERIPSNREAAFIELVAKRYAERTGGAAPKPVAPVAPKPVAPKPVLKSNAVIVKEVLQGAWGNGEDRKNRLTNAGYDYSAIMAIINKGEKPAPVKPVLKSNSAIAKEVLDGKWGNGDARKSALTKAGYDYSAIQAIINGAAPAKPVAPKPKPIKKGDKVKVLNAVQYNGQPFYVGRSSYDVIEVGTGGRVVIGVGSSITAAVNVNNLQKL